MAVLKNVKISPTLDPYADGHRRVPRRKLHKKIGLLVAGDYMIAQSRELGESGMLIESPKALVVGQKLVVTLRVPGLKHVIVLGHVVYELPPKSINEEKAYGIQFQQIDFDVKRKIRNFVASTSNEDNSYEKPEEKHEFSEFVATSVATLKVK